MTMYDDWMASDCSVMMWPLCSTNEKVSASVMFMKITKETWDTLKEMYSMIRIFLVLIIYMRIYSYCDRMVILYLITMLSLRGLSMD